MNDFLLQAPRSLILSLDLFRKFDVEVFLANARLASEGSPITAFSAVKIGMTIALTSGVERAVKYMRDCDGFEDTVVIFDYQKAGNDIPTMGKNFALLLAYTGVGAVILFPFAGPKTQTAWTRACVSEGFRVIIGGVMTHDEFLVSEGGYIADTAIERIFRQACQEGVRDFAVPGTKLEWVARIRTWIEGELGGEEYVLYAPGFGTQGGEIAKFARVAGKRWHPIIGSAAYNTPDQAGAIRKYLKEISNQS